MSNAPSAALVLAAGLLGAAGVAAAAAAAHGGDADNLAIAAALALAHAPAVLALGLLAQPSRLAALAGSLMILGVLLFSGDLAWRSLAGGRLFPGAAPAGGMLLIAGWLTVSAAGTRAVFGRRHRD